VDGCTVLDGAGGIEGIVAIGVVMGALLTDELGGGVDTLAPIDEEGDGDSAGTLPDMEEEALHSLLIESYAYPSGHVTVG
jgi:hypothetical protein